MPPVRTVTLREDLGNGINITVELTTGDTANAARVTVDGGPQVGSLNRVTKAQVDALQAKVVDLTTQALEAIT